MGKESDLLNHISNAAPQRGRTGGSRRFATDPHRTTCRYEEAVDELQGRRLARTAPTHENQWLACGNGERDPVEEGPPVPGQMIAQVLYIEHHGHRAPNLLMLFDHDAARRPPPAAARHVGLLRPRGGGVSRSARCPAPTAGGAGGGGAGALGACPPRERGDGEPAGERKGGGGGKRVELGGRRR